MCVLLLIEGLASRLPPKQSGKLNQRAGCALAQIQILHSIAPSPASGVPMVG